MIFPMVRQRTNIVTCVSCTPASDGAHEHVASLTLRTPGGHAHRIPIGEAIVQLRHPLGERYLAYAPKSDHHIEVVLGACPVCHKEPHMRLKGGGRVEDLARCSSEES